MRAHAHVPPSAIGLIVGAVLCFTILDATVKHLADRYPIPLLVWARYTVQTLVILLWLLPKMGVGLFRTPRLRLHARPRRDPAAVVAVLLQRAQVPAARRGDRDQLRNADPGHHPGGGLSRRADDAPAHRARAGGHRRNVPDRAAGSVVFQGAALLALGSAVFYGTFQILTRMLAGEDSRVLLFYPAIIGTLMMTALLPWLGIDVAMPWSDVAFIGVAGLLGTIGHFLFILAFQRAPASALTPFTYMQLVWATLDRLDRVRQFSRCVDAGRHGGDRRQRPADRAARARGARRTRRRSPPPSTEIARGRDGSAAARAPGV